MIIKSHIRAGYRQAADYLKDRGENEKIRTVEISDPDAADLDQAFHNMWVVASSTKAKKPLHHISINPFKDERLIDEQVLKIVERCEAKYGYRPGEHQRVIVEHVKDGRQHFHVMWNRASLKTNKAVWPGKHWNRSKEAAREMEKELGLKTPQRKQRLRRSSLQTFDEDFKPTTSRKGKSGKGDGHGGGAGKILSALAIAPPSAPAPPLWKELPAGMGNAPNRRRRNLWVAVERRDQGPKR